MYLASRYYYLLIFSICSLSFIHADCGCSSLNRDASTGTSKCGNGAETVETEKTDTFMDVPNLSSDNEICDSNNNCKIKDQAADVDEERDLFYNAMRDERLGDLKCDDPKVKESMNEDFLKHLDEIVSYKYGTTDMVLIEGGTFEMGSNDGRYPADREGPVREVTVKPFYIDKYAVDNTKFSEFIQESKYTTDAVRFGNSFVFDMMMPEDKRDIHPDLRALHAPWWIKLDGATWDHPEGPDSNTKDRMNHPVVHVSWSDADAFCKFHNKRLPTEEEWEMACRGGLRQKLFPWGNDFNAKNMHRANIWHGNFPRENTEEDGYFGTCPIDAFPPNNYGLHNIVGNVWEWTSTKAHSDPERDRIKKGGSFMCHKSYCYRYRCAARSFNSIDSTSSNMGFRCAMDPYGSTNIGAA